MTKTIDRIPVEDLDADTLDVTARSRDWSEGYPTEWDYAEAPDCPECGSYCRWRSGTDIAESFTDEEGEFASEVAEACERLNDHGERYEAWRCVNPECENFGASIDPHESGSEGPMMNYSYAIPSEDRDMHELADLIHDLPLCVIDNAGDSASYSLEYDDERYSLALTGGGMDLTWEIAEAFTRLGYLPPLAYCDLPGMCGRGNLSNAGTYDAPVSERDQYIIDACRRAITLDRERTDARAKNLLTNLYRQEGKD